MSNSATIINLNQRRRVMTEGSAETEPDRGFIQLHRKLLDQPFNRCPVKSSVWLYLLLNATHKPHRTYLNGHTITLQAGQIITGRKKIVRECFDQDLMTVTEAMVRGALNRFIKEEMIRVESTCSGSIITIVNWDRYQGQKAGFANQPLTKGINQPSNPPINQAQTNNGAASGEVLTNPLTSPLTNPKTDPLTTIQENNNKPLKDKNTCRADDSAKEILAYLNDKTGKKFKPVKPHLDLINARLKDYSPAELRTIVDNMAAKWGSDPRMSEYLRPATLFQAGKADGYLNALPQERGTFAQTDYLAGTEGFDHV